MSFQKCTTGIAVGYNGTILRTTDGGTNWTPQTSGTTNDLTGVFFSDANTRDCCWLLVVNILRTTNGGTNWTTQTSGTTNDLMSVFIYRCK